MLAELWFLFSAHCLIMLYICTKSHENISNISKLWSGHDFWLKITKGYNSVNNVGRVTVLVLCTLSDDALHLYQVLWKYLYWFQSYRADTISALKISKGHNSVNKCRQSYGSCSLHIVWWCFTFVPSLVKISLTGSELWSGHDFCTQNYKGA